MSDQQQGKREGKRKRGRPLFGVVGLLLSIILFHVFSFWAYQPYKGMPLDVYWLGRVITSIAVWPSPLVEHWVAITAVTAVIVPIVAVIVSIILHNKEIRESRQQGRDRRFNDAIQMAVDDKNPARALAGWKLLHLWFEREDPEDEDRGRHLKMACSTARAVLRLSSQTESMRRQDMERLEKELQQRPREAHPTWMTWPHERKNFLKKSDATRTDRDVRQQSLDFLIAYPQQEEGSALGLCYHNHGHGYDYDPDYDYDYDLSGLILIGDLIKQHRLEKRLKIHANFDHCLSMRVDSEVDLSKSVFSHAEMTGARLKGANLSDARFIGTDLRYADLTGANLSGTSLASADLRHGCLLGADLTGADLTQAKLGGSTLLTEEGSVRFHKTQINAANFRGIIKSVKRDVSAHELKALLKGCWWDRNGGYGAPLLPEGVDADDIPDSPDKTVPTGGEGWDPTQD
ncbi:MAG: pentapeptide repeat-containing protein [Alphaproteobacteria bacterium]|nr:pentapeptide repeat-containing protein [Alphaproteobacteria bacterium]MDA8005780.1 pentapeptide repeat-containing protein [Alphaproteobacteria bacterium]MDA8013172.1 pentapeptide repeat-containing protein [Alphaproteobacteria bacterium]